MRPQTSHILLNNPVARIRMTSKTTLTEGLIRCCPLTALPMDLCVEVVFMIDLEERTLMRLFLVDKLFYAFLKNQESILVKKAAQSRDRLAALLVLRSNPSYQAFFRLRKEQKIFDSIVEALQKNQTYARCLRFMRDADFWQTAGSTQILRLGFLIHHRIASIKTVKEKAEFANHLPHPMWALLCVFTRFLCCIVHNSGFEVFAKIRATNEYKLYSIFYFIEELAMFSGLRVIEDFVQLHHHPIAPDPTTNLCGWARTFQSRYLPIGDTILLPEMRPDRLGLTSHLSSNISWGDQPFFRMGSSTFNTFAEHANDEVLTVSGLLPPNADEGALFDTLRRVPVTDTRYRIIITKQFPEIQFDHLGNIIMPPAEAMPKYPRRRRKGSTVSASDQ
jgi:hypothetical protein